MISFASDYVAGAHPEIIKRLAETNMENLSGYGTDLYCAQAAEKIRQYCHCPDAEVYFLVGGTQTNQIVISTMLQPYEGVIAADSGHVNVHEAGAIEYTGHKVLSLAGADGKIAAADLDNYVSRFYADDSYEHMVFPGMVYITHPTEYGTLYTKSELEEISAVCHEYDLPLYLDGARLGYALASAGTDVSLTDIANYCDVFYIGGTKVGALCGEAVVFTKNNMPKHFFTSVKQHGGLLAKGRLLGVQFDALFTDSLYFEIGKSAISCAQQLKDAFRDKGYTFYLDSPTNQIFIVLENEKMAELQKEVVFGRWEKVDENHTVARFVTSWATKEEDVKRLIELL